MKDHLLLDLFEQAKPYLLINEEQIKLTDSLRTARGQIKRSLTLITSFIKINVF